MQACDNFGVKIVYTNCIQIVTLRLILVLFVEYLYNLSACASYEPQLMLSSSQKLD